MRQDRTIAIILPAGPEYGNRLFEGAIRYAKEHPHTRLVDLTYVRRDRSPLPRTGKLRVDGALTWLNRRDTWVDELLQQGITVINTSGDWPCEHVPVVAFGGHAMIRAAVEHLAGLERRYAVDFGFASQPGPDTTLHETSFLKNMRKRGMDGRRFEFSEPRAPDQEDRPVRLSEQRADELREFLRAQPFPAVAWCEDDYMGVLVCEAAREIGVSVPDDLAVLGCGDYRVAQLCHPPLSTIPQPGALVGYEAMVALNRILNEGQPVQPRTVIPPPPIIWRESTDGGAREDNVIQKARHLIADQACTGLTVNDLMQMLPMSQPTFTKRFREAMGHSPAEEIRCVRAENARYYLLDRDLTIARVAGLCGFSSQSKFSDFFKRETGLTPNGFRKQEG